MYLHLQQLFEAQSKQSCEIELARKDGTRFTAQLESVPTKDQDGRINGCRTVILDVTERKQAEDDLRDVLSKFEASLEERARVNRKLEREIEIHHETQARQKLPSRS